jgi:hypothetical protein
MYIGHFVKCRHRLSDTQLGRHWIYMIRLFSIWNGFLGLQSLFCFFSRRPSLEPILTQPIVERNKIHISESRDAVSQIYLREDIRAQFCILLRSSSSIENVKRVYSYTAWRKNSGIRVFAISGLSRSISPEERQDFESTFNVDLHERFTESFQM